MATITGTIIAVLPTRNGTSATSGKQWQSQTAVIETQEQYPKRVAVDITNEKIERFAVKVGETVTAYIDIDAHEYNGRWYNSIRCYDLSRTTAATQQPAPAPAQQPSPQQVQTPPPATATGDSVPF